jgi:hypothetical protein
VNSRNPARAAIRVALDPVKGSVLLDTCRAAFVALGARFALFGVVGGIRGAVVVVDDSVVVVVSVVVVAVLVVVEVVDDVVRAQLSVPGWPSLPAPPGEPFGHPDGGGGAVVEVEVLGRHSDG